MRERGPGIDRFLMRAKDLAGFIMLGWAIFKGIDAWVNRMKNLEATIIAQNVTITKILIEEKDIKEALNEIQYPERYPKRKRRENEGE